jgi:hypothetical protein
VFGAPMPDAIGDEYLTAPLTSYGTQKAAGAVEVDAVALVEIGLGLARHDGGEVDDHVGSGGTGRASSSPRRSRCSARRCPTRSATSTSPRR